MMACRIDLRHDQVAVALSSTIEESTHEGVSIFAPSWVQEGLDILTKELHGVKFEVHDTINGPKSTPLEEFTVKIGDFPLTLEKLQLIARCEPRNVTGVINKQRYSPGGLRDEVIYAIRDLVRQCIIVGLDETTHYGGYPNGNRRSQVEPVFLVDLAALQFQQAYNTGRLVLLKDKLPVGLLDDLIFERVVGEKRKSFDVIDTEKHEHGGLLRYTKYLCTRSGHSVDAYFDTKAYRRFVAADVVLTGIAINEIATAHENFVNFKFLKYGTGFFAGNLKEQLEHIILPGVIDGLEILFHEISPDVMRIKALEFPFYREDTKSHIRLEHFKSKFQITYRFSHDDALKNTTKEAGLITCTTNCGDPHAACGNEMGFGSVDGAICENLKSKGNIFCPALNKKITSKLITINV